MRTLIFLICNFIVSFAIPQVKDRGVSRLIQNDWETLAEGTTLRYFNPDKYYTGASEDDIWEKMGEDIICKVDDNLNVNLLVPGGFNSNKPFKLMTHGFSSKVTGGKTAFVNAWMQAYAQEVNVILVNWPDLAFIGQVEDWDNLAYDSAARNSIDVGEYLGQCLGALSSQGGIPGSSFHLAGHSLGAHLIGKAGRTFKEVTGQPLARLTGCDPAGPRFIDGPLLDAIPELHENRISPESAAFVDIIHTDASLEPAGVWIIPRLGDLNPLGHMDFYPDGGSSQPGCGIFGPDYLPADICSHKRSYYYLLHSILEPMLFPSKECKDVEVCHDEEVISNDIVAFMGEKAQDYYTGERKLYFLTIDDDHWDYNEHN